MLEGQHAPIQGEHRQSNATLEHQINVVAGIAAGKNQLVDAEAGGGHLPCDQQPIALGKGLKQDRATEHGRNWTIYRHARQTQRRSKNSNWRPPSTETSANAVPGSAPAMLILARRKSTSKLLLSARFPYFRPHASHCSQSAPPGTLLRAAAHASGADLAHGRGLIRRPRSEFRRGLPALGPVTGLAAAAPARPCRHLAKLAEPNLCALTSALLPARSFRASAPARDRAAASPPAGRAGRVRHLRC